MTWEQLPLVQAIERAIWATPLESLPAWRATLLRFTRLLLALVRDLASGQLTLRAMSLVYTTLLSIVPLLALSLSVLKAFGVHNQVEPALRNFLAPLGAQGEENTEHIIEFVERMNVGVLGSVGFARLLYTAVSLVQKIERSFNFIWHIAEPRSMGERFSRYLSVLLVGPILVFSALGMTAAVTSLDLVQGLLAVEPLGRLAYAAGQLLPYVLVIAAFTFIYVFVPNTHVRIWPALAGGIVGGLLWQTGGWAFAAFVAVSTRYSAIYSSLAILVLFMIWLYLSWLILLFGAAVAFYRQHPEYILPQSGRFAPGRGSEIRCPRFSTGRNLESLLLIYSKSVGGVGRCRGGHPGHQHVGGRVDAAVLIRCEGCREGFTLECRVQRTLQPLDDVHRRESS
jgi:membrane protein